MTKIKFFAVAGNANNEAIACKLRNIENLQIEMYACPQEISTVQPMPFIEVEGGEHFYGEEAIELFLSDRALLQP